MKRILLFVLGLLLALAAAADTYVNGYYRKDGIYVQGYHRTSPNSTTTDNYSSQDNINPYTGAGTRPNDYTPDAANYGSGKTIYTGPRGGQYYINDYGRKVYVPKQ